MLTRWTGDFRFALQGLRRAPGFALVATLALALGTGANTAIFSGVNALLLGPMPYQDPERLVAVWEDASAVGFPKNTPAPANYFDWRRMNRSFSDMAALRWRNANLTGANRPEVVLGNGATANFFGVLGSYPILGRTFTEQEDRTGAKVVVISHSLWKRRFAGDAKAIGQTLLMNKEPFTVIGVMPSGFAFPGKQFEYWIPAHFTPEEAAKRDNHYLEVVARLKPDVPVAKAKEDMNAVAAQLQRTYPESNRSIGAVVVPLRNQLVGDTRSALLLLSFAAALVLLIACANVANLLLIRGSERGRELAVRLALGASRRHIVGHLLIESLLLSAVGSALGLLLATGGMRVLQLLIPEDLVTASTLTLNLPVLCFAVGVSLASVLVFGLIPSLQSSRLDLNHALKQGGRSVAGATNRLQQAFVVSQIALALVLLAGAGLLIQTLANLRHVKLGFPADHLLTLATPLSPQTYDTDPKILSFTRSVVERVMQIPGVRSAAFASNLPFTSEGNTNGFRIEGRARSPSDQFNDALYREVTAGYLQTLGANLRSGRLIDGRDVAGSMLAVVINDTFARQYWPNRSPVGSRLTFDYGSGSVHWRTVVGVVADIKERGLQLGMKPAVYVPMAQVLRPDPGYLLVLTRADPAALSPFVPKAIAAIDPDQPVALVRTMDDYVAIALRSHSHQMLILDIFAGLALFLAALGLYGVLAYSVAQRRREIGVRIALGADSANVTGLVMKQGLGLTALGLALGLLLATATTRAMQSLLFEVKPLDPVSLSSGLATLVLAAVAACLIPAVTAARVDPIVALRDE